MRTETGNLRKKTAEAGFVLSRINQNDNHIHREITTNDDSQETTVNTFQQRMYKDNLNFKINKRVQSKHMFATQKQLLMQMSPLN